MVQAQNDFLTGACGHQPGEVARHDHRDHREAEPHAVREQGRARCATSRPRRPISPRRAPICAPPNPRSRRRATGLPSSARPTPRSRRSRSRARSAPRRRSMRRCPARSCSARSDPANTSATPRPASVDPVFTIGDLSTVWLVAYVRESEAPKVRVGQQLDFTVLAYPKTTFKANIDHVAASLDPNIRRLMVRATIDNSQRPVQAGDVHVGHHLHRRGRQLARRAARGRDLRGRQRARLGRAQPTRPSRCGRSRPASPAAAMIQVLQGLQPGEIVVTKGSLFVDQAASSS